MAADDSIIIYKYSDNTVQYEFDTDISGYTGYSQIRDGDGTLIAAFTCAVVNTYYLNLTMTEADLADVSPGNYFADVKLKSTTAPYLESIEFDIDVEIQEAKTRIP